MRPAHPTAPPPPTPARTLGRKKIACRSLSQNALQESVSVGAGSSSKNHDDAQLEQNEISALPAWVSVDTVAENLQFAYSGDRNIEELAIDQIGTYLTPIRNTEHETCQVGPQSNFKGDMYLTPCAIANIASIQDEDSAEDDLLEGTYLHPLHCTESVEVVSEDEKADIYLNTEDPKDLLEQSNYLHAFELKDLTLADDTYLHPCTEDRSKSHTVKQDHNKSLADQHLDVLNPPNACSVSGKHIALNSNGGSSTSGIIMGPKVSDTLYDDPHGAAAVHGISGESSK